MANAANVSNAAENADQLRRRANRRLLGASVLLLIAIILVPIFLEREPPPLPDNVDVKIPPIEGTKFDPKLPDRKAAPAEVPSITEPTGSAAGTTAPPAAAKEAAKESPKETPKAEAPKATEKAPEKTPTKPAEPSAEKATSKSSPAPHANAQESRAPALKSGQLVVQLIAVRDLETARQAFEKAKSLKFSAYTEKITVPNGVVTRVRVGPYDTKQAAENARAKLAQAGFEAKVLTLP
jgi:DedD protein